MMVLPSTAKLTAVIVMPASGRTVACRSKRCPGKKRASVDAPAKDGLLGGVSREIAGAAVAVIDKPLSARAIVSDNLVGEKAE